jgi:hypothetical protein
VTFAEGGIEMRGQILEVRKQKSDFGILTNHESTNHSSRINKSTNKKPDRFTSIGLESIKTISRIVLKALS